LPNKLMSESLGQSRHALPIENQQLRATSRCRRLIDHWWMRR
jgi:hypothetical protein